MTDLVERLRSHATPAIYSQDVNAMREAADLIEQLQRENEKLKNYIIQRQWEAENIELAAAQARIEQLEMNLDSCASECLGLRQLSKDLNDQLAAAQAREAKLREALEEIAKRTWIAAKEALAQTEVK